MPTIDDHELAIINSLVAAACRAHRDGNTALLESIRRKLLREHKTRLHVQQFESLPQMQRAMTMTARTIHQRKAERQAKSKRPKPAAK